MDIVRLVEAKYLSAAKKMLEVLEGGHLAKYIIRATAHASNLRLRI